MKRFALIGASGYIAPRHINAIKETNNELVCTLDPYDGIGIMDSYFPQADFFLEPEQFEKHIDTLRRKSDSKIDYISICSPNYLHEAHIRMALRNGANAICEKPLVLHPRQLDALAEIEKETGGKVYTILQLRLHPAIQELRTKVLQAMPGKVYDVDLTYITSRGKWYFVSWKGDANKSGGIAANIGIHFFDMLGWIFGDYKGGSLTLDQPEKAAGKLHFEKANVNWFLSVDENDLPADVAASKKRTYRKISIEGTELEFSEGFTNLHTESYRNILSGEGFGLEDARKSIEIVSGLRNQ